MNWSMVGGVGSVHPLIAKLISSAVTASAMSRSVTACIFIKIRGFKSPFMGATPRAFSTAANCSETRHDGGSGSVRATLSFKRLIPLNDGSALYAMHVLSPFTVFSMHVLSPFISKRVP